MPFGLRFIALGLVMTRVLHRCFLKLKMSSRSSFKQVVELHVFFSPCVCSSIELERKRNKSDFNDKEKSLRKSPDQFRKLTLLGSEDGG